MRLVSEVHQLVAVICTSCLTIGNYSWFYARLPTLMLIFARLLVMGTGKLQGALKVDMLGFWILRFLLGRILEF